MKGLKSEEEEERLVCVVEKVRISARLYYEEREAEAFLCTI